MYYKNKKTPVAAAGPSEPSAEPATGRRDFFKKVLGLCAVPLLDGACGGESDPVSCTDMDGLSASDKATRSSVLYKDWSIYSDKTCENCIFFEPPAASGGCGRCRIVKGAIHSNGYCTAWLTKSSQS
jgi:hypothetical protein